MNLIIEEEQGKEVKDQKLHVKDQVKDEQIKDFLNLHLE